MSVKVKELATAKDEKGRVINFDAESFVAVEGLAKSFFVGKVKVVHKIQVEKLIASKLAKEVKADLVKADNPNRSVKDVK